MIKWVLLILSILFAGIPAKANRQQDYIIIEKDYAGDILLDKESNIRYLRTDNGMYVIE